LLQGLKKGAAGVRVPEDYGLIREKPNKAEADKHSASVARWVNISNNDLETIPIGLIIMWAAYFANSASKTVPFHHTSLVYAFCLFRLLHTVVYAYGLQPWRFLAFLGGQLCVVGFIYSAVSAVL